MVQRTLSKSRNHRIKSLGTLPPVFKDLAWLTLSDHSSLLFQLQLSTKSLGCNSHSHPRNNTWALSISELSSLSHPLLKSCLNVLSLFPCLSCPAQTTHSASALSRATETPLLKPQVISMQITPCSLFYLLLSCSQQETLLSFSLRNTSLLVPRIPPTLWLLPLSLF